MGFIADIGDLGESIFGSDEKKSSFFREDVSRDIQSTTVGAESGFEQLQLDPAAIQQLIRDVLGGANGLASIFQGEQTAGIFNSSVAAQAAGDLSAKLVGEIAKITGKKVFDKDSIERQDQSELITKVGTSEESKSTAGLLETSGLSAISAALDPTGTVQSIRDKKHPFKESVEEEIARIDAERAARSANSGGG